MIIQHQKRVWNSANFTHVHKKRTRSLNHLNIDLTPSINLLLLRSLSPEQQSLCSPLSRKMKESVVLCCKSFETDGGHRFLVVVYNGCAF